MTTAGLVGFWPSPGAVTARLLVAYHAAAGDDMVPAHVAASLKMGGRTADSPELSSTNPVSALALGFGP